MTTLLITSFHSLISRNILSTELLPGLLKIPNTRIVIVCPEEKRKFLEKEFGRPGIEFVPINMKLSKRDNFLRYLALASLDTKTLYIKRRTELKGRGIILSRLVANSLGKKIVRILSSILTPKEPFVMLIEKFNPDLVFSTDVQNEYDARLMCAARQKNINVLGMVRSWDNLTAKGLMRFFPNSLIVNNEIVRDEAIVLHDYPPEKIKIVGIPHYDRYNYGKRSQRVEFFKKVGGDPEKKTVLFVPVGDRYLENNTVDLRILITLDQFLPSNFQILVRLPPADRVREFESMESNQRIIFNRPSTTFKNIKHTELGIKEDIHLADTLYHSDLIISGPSTMCIDGCVFDKPVVLFGFDGDEKRKYLNGIRRYYDYDHFRPVISSGGVKLAVSKEELIKAVKLYIENPNLDKENRKKLVELECYRVDGKSTQRLADVILKMIQ